MAKTKDKVVGIAAGTQSFDEGGGYPVLFVLTESGRVLCGRYQYGSSNISFNEIKVKG
jgi:hypothetical protein